MTGRTLADLSPTEFENLTFDLVRASGLRNVAWRTPGSDVGRDLEGEYRQVDFSGSTRNEKWFVDCKHYRRAISWPVVWEKLSYAQSQNADSMIIATQSTFSPQCIDQINLWNNARKSPVIRTWPIHEIKFLLTRVPYVMLKYGLAPDERDLPASIAPLSEQMARMIISASDKLNFVGSSSPQLEAAVAISQLSMIRTADLKDSGGFIFRPATNADLSYPWVRLNGSVTAEIFDAPHVRAIIPLFALLARSLDIQISYDGDSTLTLTPSAVSKRPFAEVEPLIALVDSWGFGQTSATASKALVQSTRTKR